MFDKILISRCFLGENVRYDSKAIPLKHPLLALWQQQKRLVAICPEVSGGLPVPREPAEQQQQRWRWWRIRFRKANDRMHKQHLR